MKIDIDVAESDDYKKRYIAFYANEASFRIDVGVDDGLVFAKIYKYDAQTKKRRQNQPAHFGRSSQYECRVYCSALESNS